MLDLQGAALYPEARARVTETLTALMAQDTQLSRVSAYRTSFKPGTALAFSYGATRWRIMFCLGELVSVELISPCCDHDGNQAQFRAVKCPSCGEFFRNWSSDNYWGWYERARWCEDWRKLRPHITVWLEQQSVGVFEASLLASSLMDLLEELDSLFSSLP